MRCPGRTIAERLDRLPGLIELDDAVLGFETLRREVNSRAEAAGTILLHAEGHDGLVEQAMKEQNLSKVRMAARKETSRSQLDRLLDPDNDGVTLHTLKRAAAAVGLRLEIELRHV